MCMSHNFLIHSSADGHLGCFHVLETESIPRQINKSRAPKEEKGIWGSRSRD